jgi:hypothetical protein
LSQIKDNTWAIQRFWQDPITRCNTFFGKHPFFNIGRKKGVEAYQLGVYLSMWGEVYNQPPEARIIVITGRGTGKTTIWQELNAADMACFMPFFLQIIYGEKKPIDVTIIFVANVKKGSRQRLEYTKNLIRSNPYLERHLVDYKQWTKEEVILKNGCMLRAEAASDRVRGYHARHRHGKVIYLMDEFAFFGGIQCMDGQKFVEEVASQSFGANIGAFTTPYGKRGGAWWAWNHPDWTAFQFPRWKNPRVNRKSLANEIKRMVDMGRQIVVDQEIRGLFVEDAGLFFTMDIWMKSINASLEWEFGDDQNNYHKVIQNLMDMENRGVKKFGYYLCGVDPNKGSKKAGADPYAITLIEKVGRKYYNRFTGMFHGRSHDEMNRLERLICKIYNPHKWNYDGGGGYFTGPMALLKGAEGARGLADISATNAGIVGYMSLLRALMIAGRFEQPPSKELQESQMAMYLIGDYEMPTDSETVMKFQTDSSRKKHGIPCDLSAMGLAIARENLSRSEIILPSQVHTESDLPQNRIDTKRVLQQFDGLADMDMGNIHANLTGVNY